MHAQPAEGRQDCRQSRILAGALEALVAPAHVTWCRRLWCAQHNHQQRQGCGRGVGVCHCPTQGKQA
jgi:hypothetical protein